MAARATGAVGAALGILLALADRLRLPLTVPLVGAALGMTWALGDGDYRRTVSAETSAVSSSTASSGSSILPVTIESNAATARS